MQTCLPERTTLFLTGSASGIGAHLTAALSRRGHCVFATDVNERGLSAKAREMGWDPSRVTCHTLDVRDASAWERALDAADAALGRVDVVMNIAGYLRPGYCHEVDVTSIETTLDVNVKGTILGTRAAARRMVARRAGHIVNVGSLASLAAVPGLCVYSASKFAVRGFTLAVAQELRAHGVSVTLVMPDAVATPMLTLQETYDEAALTFSGSRPLTVQDIEHVIVEQVLRHRPLEVTIPTSRGCLARTANALPSAAGMLAPMLRARGRRHQDRRKAAPKSNR